MVHGIQIDFVNTRKKKKKAKKSKNTQDADL